jgi:hypothetical protein
VDACGYAVHLNTVGGDEGEPIAAVRPVSFYVGKWRSGAACGRCDGGEVRA